MENHTFWHQQGSPKRGQHSTRIDRRRARAHFEQYGSTGVERTLILSHLGRQASSERLLLAIWIDRGRANASGSKAGRSGRLGKLIRPGRAVRLGRPGGLVKSGESGRLGRQGTKRAKETRHSWRELRGAERSEAPRSGSRGGWFHLREAE